MCSQDSRSCPGSKRVSANFCITVVFTVCSEGLYGLLIHPGSVIISRFAFAILAASAHRLNAPQMGRDPSKNKQEQSLQLCVDLLGVTVWTTWWTKERAFWSPPAANQSRGREPWNLDNLGANSRLHKLAQSFINY